MPTDANPSRQEQFSGTKEVADTHRFDENRLFDYMTAHVEGFEGPLTVKAAAVSPCRRPRI